MEANTLSVVIINLPITGVWQKKRVPCLNEVIYFVSSSLLADSFVLRNLLLRQAPKRYERVDKQLIIRYINL